MTGIKVKSLIKGSANTKYEISVWEDNQRKLTIHEIDYIKDRDEDYGMIKLHSCMATVPKDVLELRATSFCAGRDRVLEITCEK